MVKTARKNLRAKPAPRRRKPRGLGHERRGEILAAAKQMFLREGYETVTTRKLAERVGLSQTGLYVYFKSKEEVLNAVCRATFERLAQRYREVGAEPKAGPGLLRRLLETYVEFGLEHPDEYQLTFMAGRSAPKFHRHRTLAQPFEQQGIGIQSFLLFRDQVARLVQAGTIENIDATLAASTLWVAAHGLVALLIARPGYLVVERQALIDTLVATLRKGLRPGRRGL